MAARGARAATYAEAFRDELATLGWTDGQNIRIDLRLLTGDADRLGSDVDDIVALGPDIIICAGYAAHTIRVRPQS